MSNRLYLVANFKAKEYLSPAKFGFSSELEPIVGGMADGAVTIPSAMTGIAEKLCESGRWSDGEVALVGNGPDAPPILAPSAGLSEGPIGFWEPRGDLRGDQRCDPPDGYEPLFGYVVKHFKDISEEVFGDIGEER